jgi:alanine racemase
MCPSEAGGPGGPGPVHADPEAARAGAILTIDLNAIAENYRRLCAELNGVPCAAVVKADGYGLGALRVAPTLFQAGARSFFVAQFGEAIALRGALPEAAEIFVLNGLAAGPAAEFRAQGVVPVLNSLGEVDAWRAEARAAGSALAAALHVDTGMNRLGLPADELDTLADEPGRLQGIELTHVMSHLACADTPAHPLNAAQLAEFHAARARLPATPASLANSSGIFLGAGYHFDLGRPGVALYGVNPTPGRPNPMRQVVRLQGKILQVREIDAPRTVGYGASHRAAGPTRVATVAVGYADGYLRSLSNCGSAWLGNQRVPVVGRVSMDLITLDVTGAAPNSAQTGAFVDLIGPELPADDVAKAAGTIGYEILTALGQRYHRVYQGG